MASPISKSTFAGGITTLHIGPKRAVFDVHSNLLTLKSSYFTGVLNDKQRNNDSPIELLDENPNIFHLLVNWLYHQRIINTSVSHLEPDWQDLVHLWLLADRVKIRELQRDVIACCRRKIDPQSNSNLNGNKAVCPLDMIEYAYKNTRAKSPLRLVICEVWVENARHVKDLGRLISRFPSEFMEDVCFTVVRKAQGAAQHNDEVESLSRAEELSEPVTEKKEKHQEKEPTPGPTSQPPAQVELSQPQYELPVENIAPVAPVVESFEQNHDHLFEPDSATAATSFQGEESSPVRQETPLDDNRSMIYPSNQSVSSKSSKKKKNKGKNKNKNDEPLHNIAEPDSFERQADEPPKRYVNGFNVNAPHYSPENYQREPVFDNDEDRVPRQWTPPPQPRNDAGLPNDFSSKKKNNNNNNNSNNSNGNNNNKKKNKHQDQFANGQQGPPPTGPRADRQRQDDYYPPAPPSVQSYSHSRNNTNGSGSQYQQPQQMQNGRKNRDKDNSPREILRRDNSQGDIYQKDNYQKDNYQKDNYQKDNYQKDNYQRDNGPRDNGFRDNGFRDNSPQDNGSRDNGPQDNGFKDNGFRDNGSRDNGSRDNGPRDNGFRDNYQKDNYQRDNGPRENAPRDNGFRDNDPGDNGPRDNGPRDKGFRDNGPRHNGQRDQGYSPKDKRKQAPGSRLDPALQPSPQPMRKGKWDHKNRRK